MRRRGCGGRGSEESPSTSVNAMDCASDPFSLTEERDDVKDESMLVPVELVTVGDRETIEPDEGDVSRAGRVGYTVRDR